MRKTVFLLLLFVSQLQAQSTRKLVQAVADNTIVLNAANTGEDFKVLSPLLQGKQVVLISDGHMDGSGRTNIFRFIQYLHEEEGFDLLLIESNIYNTAKTYHDIRLSPQNSDTIAQYGLIEFLGSCAENKMLFNYIGSTAGTHDPMILAGIDIGFNNGNYAKNKLEIELDMLLRKYDHRFYTSPGYEKFKPLLDSLLNNHAKIISAENKNFLNEYADTLYKALMKITDPAITDYLFADNLFCFIKNSVSNVPVTDSFSRENMMLKNFNYLIHKKYPGKKVIVWASTAHLSICDYPNCTQSGTTMGAGIYNQFGKQRIYYVDCMNFKTAGKRNTAKKELAWYLHKTGVDAGLLMLDQMVPLIPIPGTSKTYADFFDAILYRDDIDPCTLLN